MSRARSVADLGNQNVLDLNAIDGTLKVGAGVTIENSGEVQFAGIVTAATVQIGAATTLHSTGLDLGAGTLTCHNITSTGLLTYEDVTSVDSVGIITARSGIDIGTGTSISSPASNELALGTNNVERLRISSGGDMRLGTGTPTSFGPTFQIAGTDPALLLQDTATAVDYFGVNVISGIAQLWYDDAAALTINTASGISGSGLSEKLRISSDGNVGINEATPDSKLDILYSSSSNTATENLIHLRTDPGAGYVTRGLFVKIGRDGSYDNSGAHYDIVGSAGNSGFHVFEVQGSEKLRITKDGKLILSGTARTTPFISGDGGMCIEQNYDGNLRALSIRNKSTHEDAATSMCFSLNRSNGDQDFTAGEIKLEKEVEWTTASATVDGAMVFSTIENGSMAQKMRINSAGNVTIGEKKDPAWHSSVDALTVGYAGCLYEDSYGDGGVAGRNNYVVMGNNIYYGTSGGNKYINNDEASRIMMHAGDFYFQNASGGTAESTITFNTRLKITSGGSVVTGGNPGNNGSNENVGLYQQFAGREQAQSSGTWQKIFHCGHTFNGTIGIYVTSGPNLNGGGVMKQYRAMIVYGSWVVTEVAGRSYGGTANNLSNLEVRYNNTGYNIEAKVTWGSGQSLPYFSWFADGQASGMFAI